MKAILKKHGEQKGARRADQNLHDALFKLRDVGMVPWDWIVDETRSLDDYTGWSSIQEAAISTARYALLDPWKGRKRLLLMESRSLAGVVRKLARQYRTMIAATNGQVGGFLRTDIAPVLKPGSRVLYCGDYDHQGGQIEANTRRVLEQLIGGELDWLRIALTEAQVEQYHLQGLEIMKPDHRYKPVRHHPAIECEALKQQVFVRIIRDALDAELPEPLEDVLERETRQRGEIARLLKRRSER